MHRLKGIHNAYTFQIFNAISWMIVLGMPLILLAKFFNASATTIGILTALPPLLAMLQLPASHYVDRIGYRKMMMYGWTSRAFFILVIAFTPFFARSVSNNLLLLIIIFSMFMYSLLRGFTSCAWMPWISSIIPNDLRGQYVAREQFSINVTGFFLLILLGIFMGKNPDAFRFAFIFFISTISAFISTIFLNRIPIPPNHIEENTNFNFTSNVKTILKDRNFQTYMLFVFLISFSLCSIGSFTILFLKDRVGIQENFILYFGALSTLGVLLSVLLWGKYVDFFGCKPIATISIFGIITYLLILFLFSTNVIPTGIISIGLVYFFMGICGGGYVVSGAKLSMYTVPEERPAVAFAILTFISGLTTSIVPVSWGIIIDKLNSFHYKFYIFDISSFSFLYLVSSIGLIAAVITLRFVKEHKAESTMKVFYRLTVEVPLRALNSIFLYFIDTNKK